MKNENTDIIETHVVFSTDVTINIKMKKVTRYGDLQPKYEFVEVAGIVTDDVNDVIGICVLEKIKRKALNAIKKYEDDF